MQKQKGQLIDLFKLVVNRPGKDITQQIHQELILSNWFVNFEKNSETLLLTKSGTLWVSKRLKQVV